MSYFFPFGKELTPLIQEDKKPKKVFLLGDIPFAQFLKNVADVPCSTRGEYVVLYGYGNATEVEIAGKKIHVLPLAHPRQIGALGAHGLRWHIAHNEWEKSIK